MTLAVVPPRMTRSLLAVGLSLVSSLASAQTPPRVVREPPFVPQRPLVRRGGPGEPMPPPPAPPPPLVVPEGYVRLPDEATRRAMMSAGVYWHGERMSADEPVVRAEYACQRWVVRRQGREWVASRHSLEIIDGGRLERTGRFVMGGDPPTVWTTSSSNSRWLRPPRHPSNASLSGWGAGGVYGFTLVASEPDALVWVAADRFLAYHPADVVRWYRSEAACRAAFRPPTR